MERVLPSETAMGIAARMWCEPTTEKITMVPELALVFAGKIEQYHDLIGLAWGVIANAGNGDWAQETANWQRAAARWRDAFHELLDEDQVARARALSKGSPL